MEDYNSGWLWLAFGAAIMSLEILVMTPGFYLFWLGLSAVLVGGLALVFDLGWRVELTAFAVFAVASVYLGLRLMRGPGFRPHPTLNRRMRSYVGRVFTVEEAIVNGRGKVRVGDTLWAAAAQEDMPVGSAVRVIGAAGVTGMVLSVEPVPSGAEASPGSAEPAAGTATDATDATDAGDRS